MRTPRSRPTREVGATLRNGSIPLKATIVASKEQISCSLEGESVILNLEDGVYYGLNAVASRVWELIQQPRTVREIRDRILAEYDIEEASCTRDVIELLQQLQRWNLIELGKENGAGPQ